MVEYQILLSGVVYYGKFALVWINNLFYLNGFNIYGTRVEGLVLLSNFSKVPFP